MRSSSSWMLVVSLLTFRKRKNTFYIIFIYTEKNDLFSFLFIFFKIIIIYKNLLQKTSFLLFGFFKFGSFLYSKLNETKEMERKKNKTRFQLENSYTWSEPTIRRSSNQTSEKKQCAHTCSYCIIPLYTIDQCTFAFWCRTDCLSVLAQPASYT